jgi:3-hydroxy-9,10-secoandrosta-1,3,5(10)-triene-9,17-dione monooxygenase reductase component
MGPGSGEVHYENPFATPPEARSPARRLRGRLTSGVSVWTSFVDDAPVGLTMSSVLVAEGDPGRILGLVNDTTSLWEAITSSRRFVVHLLDRDHRELAESFAGLRPAPGGVFAGLDARPSEWGPVLGELANRAYCRLASSAPAGYQILVSGAIERVELDELERPLVYFRGRYRDLG